MRAVLCLLFAAGAAAQSTAGAATGQGEFATVHIYRFDSDPIGILFSFLMNNRNLPVYLANESSPISRRKVAGLKQKRYLQLRLPPGRYIIDTKSPSEPLHLELAAGDEKYVRFYEGSECPFEPEPPPFPIQECVEDPPAEIKEIPADRALPHLKRMRPIKPRNVHDDSVVIIPKPAGT